MSQHHKVTRAFRKQRTTYRNHAKTNNLPCWLCNQPIDYTAPDNSRNPNRFNLDHYHPTSTHPHLYNDPTNFRPAHGECNEQRQNQNTTGPLGTPSRQWTTPPTPTPKKI